MKYVDRDPDVAIVQHLIIESKKSDKWIADHCGCHARTVANIRGGATRRPLNSTLNSIACKALGYRRVWTDSRGREVKL